MNEDHPVRFSVDYPDRLLNRVSTGFRIFAVIPIAIVLGTIGGYSGTTAGAATPRPSRSVARACWSCRHS